MLKATKLLDLALKAFRTDDNKIVEVDSKTSKTSKNVSKFKKSKNDKCKNSTCMPNIWARRKPNFLTFNTIKTFNHLQLAFIKAPIFPHFNLKSHIQIKTNASGYAIEKMLSQLNLDFNLSSKDLNLNKSDFNQ